MHQARILGRREALLRDPASGASNLAAAPGTWFQLSPVGRDERYELGALGFRCAGEGLLDNAATWAGGDAVLELALEIEDGYGRVRDVASLVPHHTSLAIEWRRGVHEGTVVDPEAGRSLDGSSRAGLRGRPPAAMPPAPALPAPARWTGPVVPLRHGSAVVACAWEVWPRLDPAAAPVAAPTFELATAQGGAIGAFAVVGQGAQEIARGYRDLGTPAGGDGFRWRVTLPYGDPGVATPPGERPGRTAVVLTLCAFIALANPRWHFTSLADLLERAELARHVERGGWDGQADVALLQVPLEAVLRGGRDERLRARLVGDPGGLDTLELHAIADLRHDASEA
jgi:hypothetical protein